MGSKRISFSHPTVVDVILDVVQLSDGPGDKILQVTEKFFGNPETKWMRFFGRLVPLIPFFAGTSLELVAATNPVSERAAGPVM